LAKSQVPAIGVISASGIEMRRARVKRLIGRENMVLVLDEFAGRSMPLCSRAGPPDGNWSVSGDGKREDPKERRSKIEYREDSLVTDAFHGPAVAVKGISWAMVWDNGDATPTII
jgi:hypothetical protein